MKKINIAEILKDCPKGMELYSPLCGDCKLYSINDYNITIEIPNRDSLIILRRDGTYRDNGEIMLFPKGKTTWEEFVLPKFKVGDRIVHKVNKESPFIITEITNDCYKGGTQYEVLIEQQNNFELVPYKFDINSLVPFESKVLVRDNNQQYWYPAIWGCYNSDSGYPHIVIGGAFKCCIPYKGNEHLLCTTNNCDDFYKTW